MPNLQIRDVPDELAHRARTRAARLDLSMSTYLRTLVEADIAAHAWDDWAHEHGGGPNRTIDIDVEMSSADAVEAVHSGRAERDSALDRAAGS